MISVPFVPTTMYSSKVFSIVSILSKKNGCNKTRFERLYKNRRFRNAR